MSSTTDIEGTFNISPPLTWAELRDTPLYKDSQKEDVFEYCFRLRVLTVEEETEEGVLTRKTGTALVARSGPLKARDLVKELQSVLDAFPDHTFTGEFRCSGSLFGDLWRVYAERKTEGQSMTAWDETPVINWPSGGHTIVPRELQNPKSSF